jgi:hypothetical protein
MRSARVRPSAWRPSRKCRAPAERGSVKPASREADGAKRSGLTELRTAGQSRVVMAVHATGPHIGEHA